MDRGKTFNIVLIAVFLAAITIPALFFNADEGAILTIENRYLASAPQLNKDGSADLSAYTEDLQKYLEDRVGFKEEAEILNMAAYYKLFGVLEGSQYVIGANDNIFYLPQLSLEDYTGIRNPTQDDLRASYVELEELTDYFESRGASFYTFYIPDKHTIYSEDCPDSIIRLDEKDWAEEIYDFIRDNSKTQKIAYVKDALLEAKSGGKLLYYKSHDISHWNYNGAFVGYTELMKLINETHDIPYLHLDDFEITASPTKGALGSFQRFDILCKAMSLDDTYYEYKLKGGPKAVECANETVPQNYYHYTNPSIPDAPKLLVAGDSYFYAFLLPWLAESFSDLYFVTYNDGAERMKALFEETQADIVVFEMVNWRRVR